MRELFLVITNWRIVFLLIVIAALLSAALRWRRSSGVERAQLKWFHMAAILPVIGLSLTLISSSAPLPLILLAIAAALSGVWLTIGFAVLKHRLYDIDRLISNAVGYTTVLALLPLIYVPGAVWCQRVFSIVSHRSSWLLRP